MKIKKTLAMLLLVVMLVSFAASASALSVTGGMLRMRSDPSTDYTAILYMPSGTTVYLRTHPELGSYSNGFTYVYGSGYLSGQSPNNDTWKTGWAMSSYLK